MIEQIVVLANFWFSFYEFFIQNSARGGVRDPAEDSNTGGPSLVTVRIENVFTFQYWYCELCVENQ